MPPKFARIPGSSDRYGARDVERVCILCCQYTNEYGQSSNTH